MTQHDTATDVLPEHVKRRQPIKTQSSQPTDVVLPPHDAEQTQTPAPATPSLGRPWTRTVAIIAAVAILFGITTGVMVLRSDDDVPQTVTRSVEDVHPADWQLENQARRLDALRADADRYSNRNGRAAAQPPTTQGNGNDAHLHNQAKKLQRPGARSR